MKTKHRCLSFCPSADEPAPPAGAETVSITQEELDGDAIMPEQGQAQAQWETQGLGQGQEQQQQQTVEEANTAAAVAASVMETSEIDGEPMDTS